jgi:hypothetical protein
VRLLEAAAAWRLLRLSAMRLDTLKNMALCVLCVELLLLLLRVHSMKAATCTSPCDYARSHLCSLCLPSREKCNRACCQSALG